MCSVLRQIGWEQRIQGIIVETELIEWYEKALHGDYAKELAESLMRTLLRELEAEFPSIKHFTTYLRVGVMIG